MSDETVERTNALLEQLRQGGAGELTLDSPELQKVVRRLKVMANLDLGDRTKPQQGSFVQVLAGGVRVRYDLAIEPRGNGDEAARVTLGA